MAIPDANPSHSAIVDSSRTWPDSVEGLRAEVVAGFLNAHERENAESARLLETTSFLHAAIDLLAEHGLIDADALGERVSVVMNRLAHAFLREGMGVTLMEMEEDKYGYPETSEVDCAARYHICKAVCCRQQFALSRQDVEEGILRWELGAPYMARKEADGNCPHLDRETCLCTVHENRSIPCRVYSCRDDKNIWLDFDNMVPVPNLDGAYR